MREFVQVAHRSGEHAGNRTDTDPGRSLLRMQALLRSAETSCANTRTGFGIPKRAWKENSEIPFP
jgi:hypothetical protein